MNKYITIADVILIAINLILVLIIIKQGVIKDFLGAFNNKDEGMSGRKLTAFGFACLSAYVHYEGFKERIIGDKSGAYIDGSNITAILIIDICVVLLALALIKTDDIPFLNKKGDTTIIQQNDKKE